MNRTRFTKEEWYLIIESYPVYKRGSTRASRVVESINRTISTPIWDKSSIARILPDGSFNYKPKRDLNGIIQCRSTIDQEACIYADNVRQLRQHEYDSAFSMSVVHHSAQCQWSVSAWISPQTSLCDIIPCIGR